MADEQPAWFKDHEAHEEQRFGKLESALATVTARQTLVLSAVTAIATAAGVFLHHYING